MADNLTPSEMLSAYMDGELDEQSTSSLFYIMANDNELQQEMKQQMALKSVVASVPLQVPSHLKSAVMAKTTGTGTEKTAAGFASTVGLMIGAASLASIATAWYFLSDTPKETVSVDVPVSQQQIVSSSSPSNASVDNVVSNTSGENNGSAVNSVKTASNSIVRHNSAEVHQLSSSVQENSSANPHHNSVSLGSNSHPDGIGSETEQDIVTNSQDFTPEPTSVSLLPVRISSVSFPLSIRKPDLFQTIQGNQYNSENNTFQISVRGISPTSFQTTTLEAPSKPLGNWGISAFYLTDESNAIGVEGGYDKWVQVYEGTDGDTTVRYEQHYNAPWVGIAYRHSFSQLEWLSGARPYVQGGIGATTVGPLGRTSAGLQYPILSNVTVSAGVEASLLTYIYSGSVFTSQRLGFIYSLNIGF